MKIVSLSKYLKRVFLRLMEHMLCQMEDSNNTAILGMHIKGIPLRIYTVFLSLYCNSAYTYCLWEE